MTKFKNRLGKSLLCPSPVALHDSGDDDWIFLRHHTGTYHLRDTEDGLELEQFPDPAVSGRCGARIRNADHQREKMRLGESVLAYADHLS